MPQFFVLYIAETRTESSLLILPEYCTDMPYAWIHVFCGHFHLLSDHPESLRWTCYAAPSERPITLFPRSAGAKAQPYQCGPCSPLEEKDREDDAKGEADG